MMETKTITVVLNLNPKYLHKDIIHDHIKDLLEKNVVNYSFPDLGKVVRINKVVSVGIGKIHVDTGFSKTPVTFEAEICLPKVDQIGVNDGCTNASNGKNNRKRVNRSADARRARKKARRDGLDSAHYSV